MSKNLLIIVSSTVVSAALVCGAFLLSRSDIKIKTQENHIQVTAEEELSVKADTASLNITVSQQSQESYQDAYKLINPKIQKLHQYIQTLNFSADEITVSPMSSWKNYQTDSSSTLTNSVANYNLSQSFELKSKDLNKIIVNVLSFDGLLAEGIDVSVSPVFLQCQNENEIYNTLLAKTTASALNKGKIMAANSNDEVVAMLNCQVENFYRSNAIIPDATAIYRMSVKMTLKIK